MKNITQLGSGNDQFPTMTMCHCHTVSDITIVLVHLLHRGDVVLYAVLISVIIS